MKPISFAYCAPTTVEEAIDLLAQYGSDARLLAGGQSLVPLMNLRMARPEVLIDLNRCAELRHIERGEAGVTYGAMVRQIDAERSELSRRCCPLVPKALAHAGPIAVRSRATVGGTLAHADRAAELPGVAVALNATLIVESRLGRREVPAERFFIGDMTTAVEPEEMLRAVLFPNDHENSFAEFLEVGLRREGVAIVGLATYITYAERSVIADARFAIVGVEPAPVRLKLAEETVKGQQLTPALIAEAGGLACHGVDPIGDAHASAFYRKSVTGALVRKALQNAMMEERS